ncbi:prepilin-type N-terminal cleavage/methylation domain-containing protein [Geminisphaera colitermitum]|uniref:prepilin-type N-terminal cleavage/methylation domain-containing protein n=1 Tax=Geminisphaera colitermitum TaxID=1148786 RepID=UPI000158CD00|nr:prepilin-type N-terminal cleavage/methylation domain-containing protein [Geminisphaera colitermitum]
MNTTPRISFKLARTSLPCFLRKRAFTLVELLTVIAIIGVLAGIIIPTVGKVRRTADKTRALSNLRQVAMGLIQYASDNKGEIMAANPGSDFYLKGKQPVAIWPFVLIESGYLVDGMSHASGSGLRKREFKQLNNPLTRKLFTYDESLPETSKPWNCGGWGLNAFDNQNKRHNIYTEVTTPSRVVLAADAPCNANMNGMNFVISYVNPLWPNTFTDGGANYAFCDGHVKWIKADDPSQQNSKPEGADTSIIFKKGR